MEDNIEYESGDDLIQPKKRSAFFKLVALSAAIALFLLSIQGYFYLIRPEPKVKLTLSDIQNFIPDTLQESFTSHRPSEVKQVILETRDPIKQIANRIAADSCRTSDPVCQSKALYYFVRDQIRYVPDDNFHDELQNPLITLKTGGADCEDMAVLLSALERSIGNDTRLVLIPGHAYAQLKIPKYKDQWLNMDTTCKTCAFNEVPTDILLPDKVFVGL